MHSHTHAPIRPLDSAQIATLCVASACTVTVQVVGETQSTNTDLLNGLSTLAGPTLLVAEHQTAGRGRAGRSWLSGPGGSLTFSVAWPFAQDPQALLGLPLAVGVAAAEALLSLDVPVQLKWPNDVLKAGKKLAGILVETAVAGGRTWAVVGIGLNLVIPDELEAQIGQPVADAAWLAQMDRNAVLARLLNHLAPALCQFADQGLAPFVERWNALHAYAGQAVNLLDRGTVIRQGIAVGINQQVCLLLQDQSGVLSPVMVGDVSLRIG